MESLVDLMGGWMDGHKVSGCKGDIDRMSRVMDEWVDVGGCGWICG